jgi:hypothetical protein
MGHCVFDWQFNVLTLLLSVFVFCSIATFIGWSLGSSGWLSRWSFGGSQRCKFYCCPRSNQKFTNRWQRQALPFELISRCCCCLCCHPPWLDGTFFLSSCSRKHMRWKKQCLRAHVFFSSAHLIKFDNDLCLVCQPYFGLSTPTLDGFCKGKDFLQLFCLLSAYCTMDHEKNVQSCLARINMMHGSYEGTYESQCPHMDDPVGTKTTILIWDTGDSFGLTPFLSDFMDYAKCKISVRDITKVNKVIRIRINLHKFTDVKGLPIYLLCV